MTLRNEEGHNVLLDPRFLIQLAGILITAAGLYFGLVAKTDGVAAEQARQAETLQTIQDSLPNREADDLRYQQLRSDVVSLRDQVAQFDGWVRVTREQLIKKGVI